MDLPTTKSLEIITSFNHFY